MAPALSRDTDSYYTPVSPCRLEVEDETRRLHEDHSHLQSVQRFMSTTTLTAREDARAGLHDNEKQLKLLESHR